MSKRTSKTRKVATVRSKTGKQIPVSHSISGRLAAYEAHTHITFQKHRSPAMRRMYVQLFNSAKKSPTATPAANLIAALKELRKSEQRKRANS